MWICLFKVLCVCVCVGVLLLMCMSMCVCLCLSSLCNKTPEVSEGHSGVAEERTGAGTGGVSALCACSNCRAAFQTLALGKFTAGQEKEFGTFHQGARSGGWVGGGGKHETCYVPVTLKNLVITGRSSLLKILSVQTCTSPSSLPASLYSVSHLFSLKHRVDPAHTYRSI